MRSKQIKVLTLLVVLLVFTSLFFLNRRSNEIVYDNIINISISLSISTEDLINNQVTMNQLKDYNGNYVEVIGEVIGKKPFNSETTHSGYIVLSGFVSFYFSDPVEVAKIPEIRLGDTVTLVGKYNGNENNWEFTDSLIYKHRK